MFKSFQPYPADPIFSLLPRFQEDPRPEKVNLSIGMYYDDVGELPLLSAVKEAAEIISGTPSPSAYMPMAGYADYRRAVQMLLFGPDNHKLEQGQISTIQTLGGTGALRIGADILKRHFPESGVWVCDTFGHRLPIKVEPGKIPSIGFVLETEVDRVGPMINGRPERRQATRWTDQVGLTKSGRCRHLIHQQHAPLHKKSTADYECP